MNEQVRIQILIPTLNNINDIDDTIQSIYNQSFPRKNIYVVAADFGSTDGTYEKLLTYPSERFGVYSITGDYNNRTMVAGMIEISDFTYPNGEFCYRIVLRPGDIIYPDYLKVMTETMMKYRVHNPNMIMCDVDIKGDNGIYHLKSIYDNEKIIDGKTEFIDYIFNNYNKNVFCFSGGFPKEKYRYYGMINERKWWNKCIMDNYERNSIYIPQKLACIPEIHYENELQEILLRWENIIIFIRGQESKHKMSFDKNIKHNAERNLSKYAIWRSFICMKSGRVEMARKCFMMSSVIYPEIRKNSLYDLVQQYIDGYDGIEIYKLEDIFKEDY